MFPVLLMLLGYQELPKLHNLVERGQGAWSTIAKAILYKYTRLSKVGSSANSIASPSLSGEIVNFLLPFDQVIA